MYIWLDVLDLEKDPKKVVVVYSGRFHACKTSYYLGPST
jgi:hypothetical protein